jgi:hypothetical protein
MHLPPCLPSQSLPEEFTASLPAHVEGVCNVALGRLGPDREGGLTLPRAVATEDASDVELSSRACSRHMSSINMLSAAMTRLVAGTGRPFAASCR